MADFSLSSDGSDLEDTSNFRQSVPIGTNGLRHLNEKQSQSISTEETDKSDSVPEPEISTSRMDSYALKSALFLKITPTELEKYLCTNYSTKMILQVCKQKVLTNQQSDAVVDVIVNQLLLIHKKWEHSHFATLAENITKIFTQETPLTYFTAPIKKQDLKTGQSIPPKGKFSDKFKNVLSASRKLTGLIKKRKGSSLNSSEKVPRFTDQSIDIQRSVKWLSENDSPEDELLVYWDATSKYRNKWIMGNNFSLLTHIFTQWPQLTDEKLAPRLIDIDFGNLYDCTHLNSEKWFNFVETILKYHPPICDNGKTLRDLSELESTSENLRVISQLLLLPNLVAPKNRYKNDNPSLNNKRCTVTGAKDSLVVLVKDASQLEKKQEEIKKLSKNQPVQPHIVAIGSISPGKISEIYVSVDSYFYSVSSAIKAINICFKLFHILNAEYPPSSLHIWTLIQEGIYHLEIPNAARIQYIEKRLNLLKKSSILNRDQRQDDT